MADLQAYVANENIRWTGKPRRSCFLLQCVFNRLLIFALIWAVLDLLISSWINMSNSSVFPVSKPSGATMDGFERFFSIDILLHLMPVWIYLAGVLLSFLRWRNMEYAITDRGVCYSSGIFSKQVNFKPFTEISFINIDRGIIDQMTGCGDITVHCGYGATGTAATTARAGFSIRGITDYQDVYTLIRQMLNEIYADAMFSDTYGPRVSTGAQKQNRQKQTSFDK